MIGDLTTIDDVKAWLATDGTTYPATSDALFHQLITNVSHFIVSSVLARSTLFSRTFNEIRDGIGNSKIYLRNWPVTSISSVYVDGQLITQSPGYMQFGWALTEQWDGYSAGSFQGVSLIGAKFCRGQQNIAINYQAGYLVTGEAQTAALSVPVANLLRPFAEDAGVTYANGTALTAVSASPAQGQYVAPTDVSGSGGAYQFNAADVGAAVLISYSFTPESIQQAATQVVALRFRERNRIGEVSKNVKGDVVAYSQKPIPADVDMALNAFKRVIVP